MAILVNPANGPSADETLRSVGDAARSMGLQTKVLNASTSGEINAAFARLAHERGDDGYANDILFVSADGLFQSRIEQLVALAARENILAAYSDRAASIGLVLLHEPTYCTLRPASKAGVRFTLPCVRTGAFRQRKTGKWVGESSQ